MKQNQIASVAKGGFKYHVEHIRSIAAMEAMGLSIEGLKQVNVVKQKTHEGIGKLLAWAYDALGLKHLNEVIIPSVVLSVEDVTNLIPTEGLNYLLGAGLTGQTAYATWYIALFEGNYTPVGTVTAATFPAAATESTAYTETNRVTWSPGAISAGSVSNTASKAVFTINATKTIYGIAQSSVNTKSATTGVLVSVARFATAKSVVADDILNVTSTISMTSA